MCKMRTVVLSFVEKISPEDNYLPLRTLKGHKDYVLSVAFSPDGKTIVSGSDDKTLKLWNLTPLFEWYIANDDTELISSIGKVLTKLPIGTKIKIEESKGDYLYIKVSETLKDWIKNFVNRGYT